jgi:pimeloyl-ACP methyl ester carboxylesterase
MVAALLNESAFLQIDELIAVSLGGPAGRASLPNDKLPSVQRNVGRLERITQPTFIVFHAKDACPYTPASSAKPFRALLTRAARVDVRIVEGGLVGSRDPCEARTHHGFDGQEAELVQIVTDWLKELPKHEIASTWREQYGRRPFLSSH